MDKLDRVIKALKYLHDREMWKEGPLVWDDKAEERRKITADAISELKAQQPRVMTLEEVKSLKDLSDVWLEEACTIVVAATISKLHALTPDITFFYGIEHPDYSDSEHYMNIDYGKKWRVGQLGRQTNRGM